MREKRKKNNPPGSAALRLVSNSQFPSNCLPGGMMPAVGPLTTYTIRPAVAGEGYYILFTFRVIWD